MGFFTVASLLLFTLWAAGMLCRHREMHAAVLRAFTFAAILASLYGIAQYFDIDPFQSPAAYHAQAGTSTIVRPPGTLGHADYFGWWLAIAFFCGIDRTRAEHGFWRYAGLAACILSASAILLSGTRSALLAVVVGLAALALTRLRRKGNSGATSAKGRHRPLLLVLLSAAILIAFYLSPAGDRLRARVRWSADEPIGGARPLLWRDSLRMIATGPWSGFGPETFAAEFPRYQSVKLARLLPEFYHESPHNTVLDFMTEQGLPGGILIIAWAALGLYAALRAKCPALTGALAASYAASVFGAMTIGPIFATLVIIAILVPMHPEPSGKQIASPVAITAAVSIPTAICLAIFAAWLAAYDFNLARFQRNPSVAAWSAVHRTTLPGAAEDLYCSRLLNGIDPATAIQAAERSTTSADDPPNAWYNLAILLSNANDAGAVEHALRASAALAPNWFKPHLALSNLFVLTGRDKEARTEAAKAFLLDAGKDPEVSETFLRLAH